MGIVMASADGDLREVEDYSLDMAFGDDENDFELTCDPALAPPARVRLHGRHGVRRDGG